METTVILLMAMANAANSPRTSFLQIQRPGTPAFRWQQSFTSANGYDDIFLAMGVPYASVKRVIGGCDIPWDRLMRIGPAYSAAG